ncbi:MAG TPA: hypothetical protein VHV10_01045, partial [Ktedonobacteraceae bacterium]|nr:hypothetical protein [Ktedonobacteraceae bacterium]
MPIDPQSLPYTQVGLTPVAQPTNQFHYPEVRKSSAGTQLAQVAQALAQVEPKAQQIVDQLNQADIARQQTLGAQVFANLKEQNRQGFMQAVKDGQISYQDTPFAYEYVQKAVGQAQAQQTVNQVRSQYLQDQSLHVDSMQPYADMI